MKKYILLPAVAFALTACETEDEHIDEPVAVQISATIGETLSRASDTKWNAGDNIGITMSGLYTNMKYTYTIENGDGKFTGNTMYFRNKEDKVTVTAYYPFTGTEGTSPATITVERQNPTEQLKYDFLYAIKENVSGADPNVNLVFSHMMSKVTLTFINDNADADVSKIESCVISGLVLDGTFDTLTGVCAAAKTDATSDNLTLKPTVENEKALLSLIFFPQTVGEVKLKIKDSEKDYSCELKFDENSLKSGNNYQFTIKVNKTGLTVNPSIKDWNTEKLDNINASSDDSD